MRSTRFTLHDAPSSDLACRQPPDLRPTRQHLDCVQLAAAFEQSTRFRQSNELANLQTPLDQPRRLALVERHLTSHSAGKPGAVQTLRGFRRVLPNPDAQNAARAERSVSPRVYLHAVYTRPLAGCDSWTARRVAGPVRVRET